MIEKNLFLDLEKGKQAELLRELKHGLGVTWGKMARLLKISRCMVFLYLKESSKMPVKRIQLLHEKTGLDISAYKSLKTVELPNCGPKQINEPALSKDLAEFLGILAGDGCVCETGNETSVSCNAIVDYDYVSRHVQGLFIRLFGLQPKILIHGGKVKCRIYSKKLKEFLSEKCNFPVGDRKNRMAIQKEILKDQKLLRCYL